MKTPLPLILLACTLTAFSGCGRKTQSSGPSVKPARETSFEAVTRQLDPGGTIYAYLSTDQWLAGLSTNIAQFTELFADLPGSADEGQQVARIVSLAARIVKNSGMESLDGVGISGVQVTPELHRTKLILHHEKDRGDGFLWNMMGTESHALTGLDLLTTNTAFASFGDIDFKLLWDTVSTELGGVPELAEALHQFPQQFEAMTQVSWTNLLKSLGGEAGLVLTLNDAKRVPLPGELNVDLPEPGLLIAIRVNDDVLFNRVSAEFKKNPEAQVVSEAGLEMCSMQLPVPLPIELNVTVAKSEGYLFLATSPAQVRSALAVRSGKEPGLKSSPQFADLLKYLPEKGNQFAYVGQRLTRVIQSVQEAALSQQSDLDGNRMALLRRLFFRKAPAFGLSVSGRTETGWQTVSIGNEDSATALVAAPAVGMVAIGSAMLLPALAKAKARAQDVSCVNQLKQIGLAFRIWSADNGDQFPFNVSTEKGGTLELCDRGPDGYDRMSWRHFKVMPEVLNTPRLLVCPQDASKEAASSFEELGPENVSYLVRSGRNVTESNPDQILTFCPIHNQAVYVDGSVREVEMP